MSDELKLNVLEEKENKLLERKEIKLEIIHENRGTPSKQEVFSLLSKKYSVPEDWILIDYIFSKKGTQSCLVKAKVYGKKVREIKKPEEKPPESEKPEEKGEKVEAQASKAE